MVNVIYCIASSRKLLWRIFEKVFRIFSYLYAFLAHKTNIIYRLPDWTRTVFPGGDFLWLAANSFKFETQTKAMARLKMGFLIKEIFHRFDNKSKSILDPNRSIWIYSVHDTTIAQFLNSLGLFEVK